MRFTHKIDVQGGRWTPLCQRKHGVKESLALHTFMCLGAHYAMVSDEKMDKLNVKGTICLFLGYCKGTKAYRLMFLQNKNIIIVET